MIEQLTQSLQSSPRFAPFLAVTAAVVIGLIYTLLRMRPHASELTRRSSLAQGQIGNVKTVVVRSTGTVEDYQIKEPAQGLSLAELQQVARLMQKLNIPPQRAVATFMTLRISMTGAFAFVAFLFSKNLSWPVPLYAMVVATGVGWFFLLILVKSWVGKHNKTVSKGLPDAIELMAICVDAGVSLESAIDRVARELKGTQAELANELAITWAQLSMLTDREQALMNMAERIDDQSLKGVIGTLSQSMRFGTPLAQSLRTAAEDMRTAQLVRIEEKASRLPALMTLPVMTLILPTIFLIVGGPAFLKVVDMFAGK